MITVGVWIALTRCVWLFLLIKGNKKNNQVAKTKHPIFSKQNCQKKR